MGVINTHPQRLSGAKQQDPRFRLEFKTEQWLLGEKANSQVFLQGMCLEGELPFLEPSLT